MKDEQMQSLLDAWYRDRDEAPRDANGALTRVMARLPEVRQRGRWWPLPAFERAAPIPTMNGRQPARGFTMFSAVKFMVASVIVALFGGFLLTGILTTPQSNEVAPGAVTASPSIEATSESTEPPTTSVRTDILPGVSLTVEEVEPGVYRVDNDGLRDLAKANDTDIVAGHDGGVYLLRPQRFVRLGDDEWLTWATKKAERLTDFEVTPGGTVWTLQKGAIQSFDGEEWTTHRGAEGWATIDIDVTPDGTVWAFWDNPEQEFGQPRVFGYLDEDGWQALGHLDYARQLLVAGPDDIWAVHGLGGGNFGAVLARFVDGGWQRLVTIEGTEPTWQPAEEPFQGAARVFPVAVGPDGTFWGIAAFPNFPDSDSLVRLDSSGWSRWPLEGTGFSIAAGMEVATDGSVWYASGSPADACGGVTRFDGVTPDRYLTDLCVKAIDITPDGSVWLLATEPDADLRDVYVITPEAVAATE